MRVFLVAALVCLVFALICTLDSSGLIFGAGLATWLVAAALSYGLDLATGWRYGPTNGRV